MSKLYEVSSEPIKINAGAGPQDAIQTIVCYRLDNEKDLISYIDTINKGVDLLQIIQVDGKSYALIKKIRLLPFEIAPGADKRLKAKK